MILQTSLGLKIAIHLKWFDGKLCVLYILPQHAYARFCVSVTLAFGRRRQEDQVVTAILVYIPSLRPAWAARFPKQPVQG